jgi:hypothetical protein
MHRKTAARLVLGGSAVMSVWLATASLAWACTTYVGRIEVSGNGTGNVAKTIDAAEPQSSGMDWCHPDDVPVDTDSDTLKSSFWTARVNGSSPSLTVTVSTPDPVCDGGGEGGGFPPGTWNVKIKSGYMNNGGFPFAAHNCHSGSVGLIDTSFSTDSGGYGTETYNLTSSLSTGWYSVCVYHDVYGWAAAQDFKVV